MIMFSKKLEEIKNAVLSDDIKVVSFDIFDTLVVRPCVQPVDLFKIVGKRCGFNGNFVYIRRMAEQYARRNKPYYYDDITIHEIYEEFTKLAEVSEERANEILQCELDVEYDYIMPRNSIRELYNMAKNKGKKIIIVSDMYLPKKFIEKVLEKNEITGYYKLYVSSDERVAKGSGRLFQKIITEFSKEGIGKECIVHLGDNTRSDVDMPKSLGMKAFHLPNAIGIMNSKVPFKDLVTYSKRTDSTFLVGCLANYLFDDPYFPFNKESISTGNAKLMGAVLFGPLLLSYTKWLIEDCIKNNIDKILLVMRDGYIIDKIYNVIAPIYENAPATDDIFLSRMIRYYFYGKEKNGLINSFGLFGNLETMTVDEFMEKRLLVKEENRAEVFELFKSVGYADGTTQMGKPIQYYSLLPELQKIFANNSKEEIGIVEEYCRKKVANVNNLAVVDVGYRGSVSRFLQDEMQISNIGYQMLETPLSNQYVRNGYDIRSFISYSFKLVSDLKILHPLVEDIISIQEGTATKIEKNNNEYVVIKKENFKINETLTEMQQGVMEYVNHTFEALKNDIKEMDFDEDLFFDVLVQFLNTPNSLDVNVIKKLSFEDSDFIKIGAGNNIYSVWVQQRTGQSVEPVLPPTKVSVSTITKVSEVVTGNDNLEIQPWQKISKVHLLAIKVCEKIHILDWAISVKHKLKSKNIGDIKNGEIVQELFEKPMENALNIIKEKNFDEICKKSKVLLAGHITSFDKGTCNFVNQLHLNMVNHDMLFMSECIHLNEDRTRQKINFPFFIVPKFLGKDYYPTQTGVVCSKRIKKYVNKKAYLKWGVNNLIKRHEDIEEDYVYYLVYFAEMFVNKMLDIVQPKYIIMWNEFFAFHHILKNICAKREIEVVYLEFGSLPGTISIEHLGQMGASFSGKYAEDFMKLDVADEEMAQSIKVLEFLKNSKLNRNVQPINDNIEDIKNKLKKGRPVILYAGVNDYESGLVPYTKETQINHSPVFKSSEDALLALAEYAKKNDYNLIYKPHPIIERQTKDINKYDDNVIMALNVDINDVIDISDVVVTILSQVSYTALIREKAVVMLGFTQLKGKECCYETFTMDSFDETMDKAVNIGYTEEMHEKFIQHIAHMNKYVLYDDLQNRSLRYGKSIKQAVDFIFNCDNTIEWYRHNT